MSALANLKLSNTKRTASLSPIQIRRNKLAGELDAQIEAASGALRSGFKSYHQASCNEILSCVVKLSCKRQLSKYSKEDPNADSRSHYNQASTSTSSNTSKNCCA